jgi:hypothetical protein
MAFHPTLLSGPEARPWIAGFFASLVLQLWTGFYLGWFLLLGLGIAAVWALVLPRPRRRLVHVVRNHAAVLLGCAAAGAAALAPMATHYLEAAKDAGYFPYDTEIRPMLPRLQSWLYVGRGSWLYSWQERIAFGGLPRSHEHRIGVGLLTTVVAAAGLAAERRRPWVAVLGLSAATVALLATLFPGDVDLWRLVHDRLPAGGAVRAVSRIGLLLLIPAAVGIALFLQRVKRGWAAGLVALLCVLEQGRTTPSFDKVESREDVWSLAARIGPACGAFYYSPVLAPEQTDADWRVQDWKLQVDAMWAGMLSGVPTVNGYSGRFPPGWPPLFDNRIRGPADEARIRSALAAWSRQEGVDLARLCRITTRLGG